MTLSRRHLLTGLGAGAAVSLLPAARTLRAEPAGAAEPLRVGFVYVGPVSDHGWSYQHDQGRLAAMESHGDRILTTLVENVPEGPDAERVLESLVEEGCGLIFATSFGFMNAALRVAERYPEVRFEHATGYKRLPNLATYSGRFYEGRTVCGQIAGQVTRSGIIGYVGSYPISEVISGINAFTLALRQERPDAEVRVVWLNTWYDPARETDAARALIEQGADVLAQHTDSPAPVQAAEAAGIVAFGQSSDMSRFAPKAHLTSIVDDWAPYYIERIGQALAGTWDSADFWGGLATGTVRMTAYNPVLPEAVRSAAQATEAAVRDGTRHPFAGPISDRDGTERIAAGAQASDAEILAMDWFVPGVVGELPR